MAKISPTRIQNHANYPAYNALSKSMHVSTSVVWECLVLSQNYTVILSIQIRLAFMVRQCSRKSNIQHCAVSDYVTHALIHTPLTIRAHEHNSAFISHHTIESIPFLCNKISKQFSFSLTTWYLLYCGCFARQEIIIGITIIGYGIIKIIVQIYIIRIHILFRAQRSEQSFFHAPITNVNNK